MITSRQNAWFQRVRNAIRDHADEIVIEGPKAVADAMAGGWTPIAVIERAASGEQRAGAIVFAEALFDQLSETKTAQGVLALFERPRTTAAELFAQRGKLVVALDGVQDPGNVGAIARVAEAAGVCGLACGPGTADPNHPRALRASAGSLLRLPAAVEVAPEELRDHLRSLAPRWIALVAHGGGELYDEPLAGALVLALGAEGAGLSPAAERLADLRVRIPTEPPVESLNVATAAAVVLFELRRRRALAAVPA